MIRLLRYETKKRYMEILRLYPEKSAKEIAQLLNMEKSLVYKYLRLAIRSQWRLMDQSSK